MMTKCVHRNDIKMSYTKKRFLAKTPYRGLQKYFPWELRVLTAKAMQ